MNGVTPDPNVDKKKAVDTYLEQVKVVTALATTLLLTPNVLLTLENQATARQALERNLANWRCWLIGGNLAFLLTVLLTYFIYATAVGFMHKGQFNVYRPATIVLSLVQLVTLVFGCVALFVLFRGML